MYSSFFNFKEKPFKLVPNPEFLFMAKSHEEALAHLTYATSQGDGFVKITGEVGTGKTTLCRVFLEDLDSDMEAAFIFNSKVDSIQLLKVIHRELGINCESVDPSDMTFALNDFLLEKKSLGKSVILLIDEAQNLSSETLEQLRLLSNLETTRSKLLQIILVGQPELEDILDSYELRQLRQRINLSCHILPMSHQETKDYIEHRINVASRKPQNIFTRGAINKICQYSRGIPRLINIVCDRSLLAAYSLNKKKVTSSTIKVVLKELDSQVSGSIESNIFFKLTLWFSLLTMGIGILYFITFLKPTFSSKIQQSENPIEKMADKKEIVSDGLPSLTKEKKQPHETSQKDSPAVFEPLIVTLNENNIINDINKMETRENIFSYIVNLWGDTSLGSLNHEIGRIESDLNFFELSATLHSYHLLHIENDYDTIRRFNLPAILSLISPGNNTKRYIAIIGFTSNNDYIIFTGDNKRLLSVDHATLHPYLTGDIFIPWKDNLGSNRIISESSPKASILSIKLLLNRIGFTEIDLEPVYDSYVKNAIKQIQAKYNLAQDGIVGPLTKLALYNEKREDSVPYLDQYQFSPNPIEGS